MTDHGTPKKEGPQPPANFAYRAYLGGPADESLWWAPTFAKGQIPEVAVRAQMAIMKMVETAGNDRLLALVGHMAVDGAIDRMLAAIMPKLDEWWGGDPGYQLRLRVLAALNLCPEHYLQRARLIAEIRNTFAHEIEVEGFSDLDGEKLKKLKTQLAESIRDKDEQKRVLAFGDAKCFKEAVVNTAFSLHAYALKVEESCARMRDEAKKEQVAGKKRRAKEGRS